MYATYCCLAYCNGYLEQSTRYKGEGIAVRCIHDNPSVAELLQELQNTMDAMLPSFAVPSSGSRTITLSNEVTYVDVSDENGPTANYGNNWNGTLTLVTNRANSVFKITGSYATEGINYDSLMIYNGSAPSGVNTIRKMGGSGTITEPIYTSGNTVTIKFRSNGNNCDYAGFTLHVSIVPKPSCTSAKAVDVEGNYYNTVQIGEQCWTKENMRATRYADWSLITLKGTGSSVDTSSAIAYRYYPNKSSGNVATHGYLYNWPAVMHGAASSNSVPGTVQGICPSGWHVPNNWEWSNLTTYVSGQSSNLCNNNSSNIAKALAATTGWATSTNTCATGNNLSANNATGFTALPSGVCLNGDYSTFGTVSYIMLSQLNTGSPYGVRIYASSSTVTTSPYWGKAAAGTVRCLRN